MTPTPKKAAISSSSQSSSSTIKIPDKAPVVGDPQRTLPKEYSIDSILKELAAINQEGPQNYCILGTRHCSFLHQQIIELLAYALVLSGNHVFTSGSGGTNAAAIRGALRAERQDLLTVVLPQVRAYADRVLHCIRACGASSSSSVLLPHLLARLLVGKHPRRA